MGAPAQNPEPEGVIPSSMGILYYYLRKVFPLLDVDMHPEAESLSFIGQENYEIALRGMTDEATAVLESQQEENETFTRDLARLFNTLVYVQSAEDISQTGKYIHEVSQQLAQAGQQYQEKFPIRAEAMEVFQRDAEGKMAVHVGPRWPEFREVAIQDMKELCDKHDICIQRLGVLTETAKRQHAELLKRMKEVSA
ncbi:hypothetical protein RRF57_003058 [Xylaria bambusicola]|uniref:Uncharacterized protein n=1 Tax=Xylaria bambusicola TaxID=326684 RepID=A0AAN7UEI4_9PEZI